MLCTGFGYEVCVIGRVRLAGAIGVVALLLASAPAASAGPSPGARYDGADPTGRPIWLSVAQDGSRLEDYLFQARIPCSDGKRRTQGLIAKGERPVLIDAAGAFTYSSTGRLAHRTRRGAVRGRFALTVSGAFSAAGDVVSGTIETTFRSRRFDCSSGPVAYTLHLDGTPGAPWRDATLATGRYTAKQRGLAVNVDVLAPGREVVKATIDWSTRCENRDSRADRNLYSGYLLRDGRMSVPGSGRRRVGKGDRFVASDRWRLTLRFTGGAAYRFTGRWRITSIVRLRGRLVAVCRFDKRFAGQYVSGTE